MHSVSKRVPLGDPNDPLFRRVRPALYDVFCRGILETPGSRVAQGAIISIVLAPLSWPLAILTKSIHLLIALAILIALHDELSQLGAIGKLIVVGSIVTIFYNTLYDEVRNFLFLGFVALTAGRLLRWVCAGYLSGTGFRQAWLLSEWLQWIIVAMAGLMPSEYESRFDYFMNSYLDSNDPETEARLRQAVTEYEASIAGT